MQRFTTWLIAIGFLMGALASSQQESATEAAETNENDAAMVRFVHAAPNADVNHVL